MKNLPIFASISVHKKPTEDKKKVRTSIRNVLPDEDILLKEENLESYWGGKLVSFTARLKKSAAKNVYRRVITNLEGLYPNWISERFDSKNETLYIRIDKQLAFLGRFKLTEGGNVVHMQFSFPGYLKLTPDKLRASIQKIRKNNATDKHASNH